MTVLPITEAGVYSDITAEQYHADCVAGGSLSSTGARRLLSPSCPAKFKHERDHGRADTDTFAFGRAAHARILGVGDPIKVITGDGADPNSWNTKTTKIAVAEARAAGFTPVKPADDERVDAMVAALRADEHAAPLLTPHEGKAEQTLVWRDDESDVWCRAMIDWLPEAWPGQRLQVVDYKTGASAEPESISRSVATFGYMQQAAWYLDGIRALDLDGGIEPEFTFIFQEKDAPHLVTVVTLDAEALSWGRIRNRKARDVYRRCTTTDTWPGYTNGPIEIALPAWERKRLTEAWTDCQFDIDTEQEIPA